MVDMATEVTWVVSKLDKAKADDKIVFGVLKIGHQNLEDVWRKATSKDVSDDKSNRVNRTKQTIKGMIIADNPVALLSKSPTQLPMATFDHYFWQWET